MHAGNTAIPLCAKVHIDGFEKKGDSANNFDPHPDTPCFKLKQEQEISDFFIFLSV
jgi:hypothetical protein